MPQANHTPNLSLNLIPPRVTSLNGYRSTPILYKHTHLHPLHHSLTILFNKIMFLRAPLTPTFFTGPTTDDSFNCALFSSPVTTSLNTVCAAVKGGSSNHRPLTGVVFEPFEEVKKELNLVPSVYHQSLARQKYADESEASINEQINVEYNVSYVYHAMYAYFDRDNVALKGLAKFFKESSEEEREHAEKFMEYQNKRGGKVKLQSIIMPLSEFDHEEKGDALYAMELALSLEKLTNEKLLNLHEVACRNNDVQLADFVESEFLGEQVEAIKKISEYVAQLRRVGKGHGVWHFNQMLLNEGAAA
ncbi:putative ferroxidase [Helianthus debilis subsp. tardiflorus]